MAHIRPASSPGHPSALEWIGAQAKRVVSVGHSLVGGCQILGFYGDNGQEHGNYYNGFYRDYRVYGWFVKIIIPYWVPEILGAVL